MAWTAREFSDDEINWAGRVLTHESPSVPDMDRALVIINNLRKAHGYPLNTFQVTLRQRGQRVDPNCLVAQRTKRLSSIRQKLAWKPDLALSEVQDLGGCRAILSTIDNVHRVHEAYKAEGAFAHSLLGTSDYIKNPKKTGYRGIHLIYAYVGKGKYEGYSGLRIEVQLRSRLQHAWATAVETVDIFTGQLLKSSRGDSDWARFFALMGSALAWREGAKGVPKTPKDRAELRAELRDFATRLRVKATLEAASQTLKVTESQLATAHSVLLQQVHSDEQTTLSITGYDRHATQRAHDDYLHAEQRLAGSGNAVLVSVSSIEALRTAYPNYYVDTDLFIKALDEEMA